MAGRAPRVAARCEPTSSKNTAKALWLNEICKYSNLPSFFFFFFFKCQRCFEKVLLCSETIACWEKYWDVASLLDPAWHTVDMQTVNMTFKKNKNPSVIMRCTTWWYSYSAFKPIAKDVVVCVMYCVYYVIHELHLYVNFYVSVPLIATIGPTRGWVSGISGKHLCSPAFNWYQWVPTFFFFSGLSLIKYLTIQQFSQFVFLVLREFHSPFLWKLSMPILTEP